jgi:hypothetical protein
VARSGARVLGRVEVYSACKGVSERVPPGGCGALVAAAPLRTLPRAFVFLPLTFWWGKVSPESRVLTIYTAPNAFFFRAHGPVATSFAGPRGDQKCGQRCAGEAGKPAGAFWKLSRV